MRTMRRNYLGSIGVEHNRIERIVHVDYEIHDEQRNEHKNDTRNELQQKFLSPAFVLGCFYLVVLFGPKPC